MPKPRHNSTQKKKAMLKALEDSLGVVTTAARNVGIDRHTHYNWLQSDPKYAKAVEELHDVALDFAESHLFAAMKELHVTAILGYLNNKGEKRGYNAPSKSHTTVTLRMEDDEHLE